MSDNTVFKTELEERINNFYRLAYLFLCDPDCSFSLGKDFLVCLTSHWLADK